jgi:hypothetical protein
MAKISERIGRSRPVILPARSIRFEIEAISASFGFDPFCPLLRWQVPEYIYIPITCRLALNKMVSNLDGIFNRS